MITVIESHKIAVLEALLHYKEQVTAEWRGWGVLGMGAAGGGGDSKRIRYTVRPRLSEQLVLKCVRIVNHADY